MSSCVAAFAAPDVFTPSWRTMMVTRKKTTKTAKKKAPTKMSAKPKAKPDGAAKKTATKKERKASAIDGAAKVLGESKEPMTTKEMIDAMSAKGWGRHRKQWPDPLFCSALLLACGGYSSGRV
jgi:hypothetical protein